MVNSIELARRIRCNVLDMTHIGQSSHIGSVFSIADIIAVLYGTVMKFNPSEPKWSKRDRFVLSKGHAGAGVYAVLAECGFFSTALLKTHYQDGSKLSGHVSHKGVPGVEFSTGSLGHGLPVAVGMAKSAVLKNESHRVFVLLSDGECDEGANWEAMLFASHHKLKNLVAIVDYNKLQSLATVEETLALEPFSLKWQSFGWEVIQLDGHDHKSLATALCAERSEEHRPLCILAETTKGKGVSFMENSVLWHYRSPQGNEYLNAKSELDESAVSDA